MGKEEYERAGEQQCSFKRVIKAQVRLREGAESAEGMAKMHQPNAILRFNRTHRRYSGEEVIK
jgi:hypothetical protein